MTNDPETPAKSPHRANITTISEACHVSRGRAAELLKAAGMRRDRAGTYLFDRAREAILALVDPARSAGHVAGGDGSALSDGVAGNVNALSGAKAQYEAMRTRKMALEIEKIEGRLIERAAVIEAARDIAAHVRAGLAGVPAKVANDLAAASTAATAEAIVGNAIHEALLKLTDLGAYILGEAAPG